MGRLAIVAMMAGLLLGACDNKSDSAGANSSAPKAKTFDQPTAPIVQKPHAELAQMFSLATEVLSSVKTSEGFAEIKPISDVSLEVQGNALKIKAVGSDPAIFLPSFPGDQAIAEIVIKSPADTTLQLFYRLSGMEKFSEASSIWVPIKAGRNVVYMQLPAWIGVLRLDPGQVPGDYLLESVQVKRVTSPDRIP